MRYLCTRAIAPVLSPVGVCGPWGGGEDTGVGIVLCLTSCLCPQDCSAMHPWTSLAPAGPRAPQGSWWFDPVPPISTVSATTPQVRERVEGGLVGSGGNSHDNNSNNNTSRGYSHRLPKASPPLLGALLILPALTVPLADTTYNSSVHCITKAQGSERLGNWPKVTGW